MSDIISQYRYYYPEDTAGKTDEQLAEQMHSKYAPNYDKNEYYRELGVPLPGFGEEFGKGMAKSFAEMGVLAMDAAPAVALSGLSKTLDAIGVDNSLEENARAKADEAAQKLAEVQDKYGAQTKGYKDVKDITSALQYAGSMAGSGAGSTISTVVPGLLSGGATAIATAGGKAALKQGLKQAALKFGKNLTEDQVEAQVTKGVMSKAFSKGFQAGAMGTATAAETGSTYLQNLEDGIDAPGIAIVAGAIKGSLEVLPEFMAISRIFKSPEAKDALADATAKQVLKRFGYNVLKEQGKLGATEAATEALQSAVDIAANDFVNKRQTDLFSPQNIDNLIESGLAGFIGSGPGSVITGGIQTLKDIKPATVRPEDFKHEELTEEVLDGDLIMQDLKSALLVPAPKEDTGASIVEQRTQAFDSLLNSTTVSIPKFAEEMDARVATVRKDNLNAPEDILLGGISSRGSLGTARPDQKVNAIAEQKQALAQEKAPELPVGLRTAKPRFNEYSLKFPSDFEKALYISTRKSKPKRGDDYRTWLKDSYGMTDYEIDQAADQVVNSIKNSQPDSKDSMRITVPKMDKPKRAVTETVPLAQEATVATPAAGVPVIDEPIPFAPIPDRVQEDPVAKAFRESEAARDEVQFQSTALGSVTPVDALPRIESRDTALADLAFKNVRGIKFKNSPMLKQEQQRLEKLIKNIAGPKADVQFFDDMFAFEDPESNIANPVRGAQWLNTIGVALSFNNARGLSNTETGLHEAFHFVHRWALTDGEKRLLANQKQRMEEYVSQKTGAQIEDVSLFDTEEVAATAFGLWAEEHLNKQPPTPKLGPVNAVFKKIADVLRTIRDSFKKAGYKKFEDLFEDVLDGKKAQEFLREVTEQDRLVRNQAAVAHARKVRSDRIIQTPQKKLLTAESLTKMAGDIAKEDLLEFTNMQEFMMKAFNTAPGMASKDPVFAIIFGAYQNQQQNNSILDRLVIDKVHELYKNPKRLQNASGIMDFLNSTSQKLLQDGNNRLVYKKDGKLVALNPLVSGDVVALRDGFNTILKLWRETTNEKFKEIEGFDNVDQAIAHQENIVTDPTMDQANLKLAEKRLIQLKETKKSLEHINRLLESDIPYFPRMAQGKYGVKIIDKTDPKRVLPQSFAMIGETLNGQADPKQLQEVKKRWAEELGYTGSQYEITPAFKLNRDNIYRALNKGDLKYNLELLGSLMESISPEIADEVQAAMDKISGGVARSRLNAPFLERNDTLLYSKDYSAVIPAYFSNATKAINRYRYAEANDTIKKWIDQGEVPTPDGSIELNNNQSKLYKEMFEYFTSPKADMSKTRAFNFFWAMGGNVSTAMLNFVTMPTMVVGAMNTYGGNPLTNNAVLMRNFGLVSKMMLEAKLDVEMFGNETFLRKHIKDEKMVEALIKAHARGEFRPARAEDMLGSNSFTSGKVGSNGYVTWGLEKGKDILAAPIQAAEEISRVTSFMSLYETLREDKNPNALKNYEANFVKGNHRYEAYKAMNKDLDPATYAALFAIEETHGVFSKLGRGKNQQGIWGSLVFPFMQHPLMMMGLLSRMARGNMVSKQAAMYMIFSMMMLAGLYGIPGWELWKEGTEALYKTFSGKEKDFHHEMKKLLVTKMHFSPKFAEATTEGLLKPFVGIDVSRRMGVPLFFQDALIPLMNGQDGVDQVLGVAGSVTKSFMNDTERLAQGEINPLEMMYNAMAPVSMRNIFKALVTYPTEGVRTGKGTQIMTPQDIGPQEMLVKAFGFQPSQVSREYEKRNAERLGSMGWRTGYNRYTLKIARAQQEAIKLAEEGRDTTKQQAKIRELYKDLADFAVGAGVPVTRDFWQGANTSISNKVMNALHPDIPKKESKAVDQGILNLLYEGQD